MDKNRKKTRPSKSKPKTSFFKLFALFITIAVVTIIILEYIDYKKGSKSFIFTKVIPLEKTVLQAEKFNKKFIAILKANNLPYDYFQDKEGKYHFSLEIDEARFDKLVKKISETLKPLGGELELTEVQGLDNKSIMLYKTRFKGEVFQLLLVTRLFPVTASVKPAKKTPPTQPPTEKPPTPGIEKPVPDSETGEPDEEEPVEKTGVIPRIAFIIDDMGAYDIGGMDLKELNVPVTASVIPDSRRAREVVRELEEYHIKTLIHLPMQPTNSNGKQYDPGQVITINSTDEQIRALVRRAKQFIPNAKGVNNHEGSRITSDKPLMERIIKILKEEDLFFIDSRTIAKSVAYDVAKSMNVPTTKRDVFLDHIVNYSESMTQIRKMVEIARQTGKAIAIGHPFDSTLQAIRDSIPYIESNGVKVVFVSDLLE